MLIGGKVRAIREKGSKRQQYYQQLTRYPNLFFFLENIWQPHLVKRLRLNGLIFSSYILDLFDHSSLPLPPHRPPVYFVHASVLHPTEQDTHLSNDIGDCLMLIWLLHLYSYEPKQKGIEYQRNIDSIF